MKSFKKNYIGKGTQVENMDIVKVTLPVEEVLKFKHEWEGTEYLTFEVAKMKETDKFGRTHTAYVSVLEETEEETKEEKPKKKTSKK